MRQSMYYPHQTSNDKQSRNSQEWTSKCSNVWSKQLLRPEEPDKGLVLAPLWQWDDLSLLEVVPHRPASGRRGRSGAHCQKTRAPAKKCCRSYLLLNMSYSLYYIYIYIIYAIYTRLYYSSIWSTIKIVPQCYIEAVCLIYKGYQGVSLIPKAKRSEVEEDSNQSLTRGCKGCWFPWTPLIRRFVQNRGLKLLNDSFWNIPASMSLAASTTCW